MPSPPTPSASPYGSHRGGAMGRVGESRPSLDTLIPKLPTPTSRYWKDAACREANVPTNGLLGRFVVRLPSPTAGDAKASGASGYSTDSGRHSGTTLTDAVLGAASAGRSGRLNPLLSEWMQGLPIGWSGCEPLETSALRRWSTLAHSSLWRPR